MNESRITWYGEFRNGRLIDISPMGKIVGGFLLTGIAVAIYFGTREDKKKKKS